MEQKYLFIYLNYEGHYLGASLSFQIYENMHACMHLTKHFPSLNSFSASPTISSLCAGAVAWRVDVKKIMLPAHCSSIPMPCAIIFISLSYEYDNHNFILIIIYIEKRAMPDGHCHLKEMNTTLINLF